MNKANSKNLGGHTKMVVWQSIEQLDDIVQDILMCIPKNKYKIYNQLESSNDSVASNFVEGYYSGYLDEYIKFLKYSRRSGAEVYTRGRRVYKHKYFGDNLYKKFEERCVKTMYLIDRTRQSLEKKRNQL